jgi:hypothetical protein
MQKLAANGRFGDSMMAHIQPADIAVLLAAGKAGTVNPHDGALEFYDVGATGRGRAADHADTAGAAGGGAGGGKGGDGGGPPTGGYGGSRAPDGTKALSNGATSPDMGAHFGGWNGGPNASESAVSQKVSQDLMDGLGLHSVSDPVSKAMSFGEALGKATTQTPGGMLGRVLGLSYSDPYTSWNGTSTPNVDLDVLGLGLKVGSLLNPGIGLASTAYGIGKAITGWKGMNVSLGTNIVGHDFANQPSGLGGSAPNAGNHDAGGNGFGNGIVNVSGSGGYEPGTTPTPSGSPTPTTTQTQAETPKANVTYLLPIKNRDSGQIEYKYNGGVFTNPSFLMAQGWGQNIITL